MDGLLKRMGGVQGAQPPPRASTVAIVQSAGGAALGIGLLSLLHFGITDGHDATFILGSFGASCVLVFGAPTAPFSQPRNVIGGHLLSAFAGVAAAHSFPIFLAAPLAVSGSVALMQGFNTVHPPAGGTALIAVLGSPVIHAMGYGLLVPTFLGSSLIVGTGLLYNNLVRKDIQYPMYW